jgi:hypothetical protein
MANTRALTHRHRAYAVRRAIKSERTIWISDLLRMSVLLATTVRLGSRSNRRRLRR